MGVPPEEAQHLTTVQTDYSRSVNAGAGAPQTIAPLKFVKEWHLEDFDLSQPLANRSLEQGKATFRNAQCVLCHRFGSEGAVVGPDLTAVASRFDRKALLESMIDPSKVIDDKFRNINFVFKDGNVITGSIDREDNEKIYVRENPLATALTEVRKENVARRELSAISPMPNGLLNPLEKEQNLDLLAYLERGVNLSETKR